MQVQELWKQGWGHIGCRGGRTNLVSECILRRDMLQLLQSIGGHVHGTRFALLQAPLLVELLVGCRGGWWFSPSVMFNSLQPHGLQPTRLLSPWDFPGKNTGVGCHSLLHGIFPT